MKVLDFGLAKTFDTDAASAKASDSPTITSPAMTTPGVILGTAAYMAPEQAKGKPVDRRADVWALGAVIYEMLTGRRAFAGEDTTDTLVAVLSKEPDWSALPANTPVSIRSAVAAVPAEGSPAASRFCSGGAAGDRRRVERGVRRDRADRGHAVPTYANAMGSGGGLRRRSAGGSGRVGPVATLTRSRPRPAWTSSRPIGGEPTSFALSPDGRQIVFAAAGDGDVRLWLRDIAVSTAQPLSGTADATYPFWSPDGRSVGFFAGGMLKRLDLGGGASQTLARAPVGRGGTWHADGSIIFSPDQSSPLMRVAASGGDPVTVTRLEAQQRSHRWPHLLPSGREVLYASRWDDFPETPRQRRRGRADS